MIDKYKLISGNINHYRVRNVRLRPKRIIVPLLFIIINIVIKQLIKCGKYK